MGASRAKKDHGDTVAPGGGKRKASQAFTLQLNSENEANCKINGGSHAARSTGVVKAVKPPVLQPLFPLTRTIPDADQTIESIKTWTQDKINKLEKLVDLGSVSEANIKRKVDEITALANQHMAHVNETLKQSVVAMQQVKESHNQAVINLTDAQSTSGRKGDKICKELMDLVSKVRSSASDEIANISRKSSLA